VTAQSRFAQKKLEIITHVLHKEYGYGLSEIYDQRTKQFNMARFNEGKKFLRAKVVTVGGQ
jgi:hypothetical protein